MVLGYYEPRPERRNYVAFVETLVKELQNLGNKGVSLMLYGSYVRGDYIPGRSDIDGVLIFPDDVVIDKKEMLSVSTALKEALEGNNVPFQVTAADITTMSDGRFNSFDPNFKSYFDEEGQVVVGPDYRPLCKYSIVEHSDQNALRFNLRKSRLGLLFSEHDQATDYEKMLERFNKTLDATSRASKQIMALLDGKIRGYRFSALEELALEFPDINTDPLARIKHLYENPTELDKLYLKPNELISFWNQALTFFESLIKSYIHKIPNGAKNLQL